MRSNKKESGSDTDSLRSRESDTRAKDPIDHRKLPNEGTKQFDHPFDHAFENP